MLTMKKYWAMMLAVGIGVGFSFNIMAAQQGDLFFDMPKLDHKDEYSLQRGAAYYMNFCSGCHSLQFMRYERMAKDIGVTDADGDVLEATMRANLMFTSDRIGDQILVAMETEEARQWFGVTPPDLSLTTRAHSPKWLYNYLLSFYVDDTRPWGVNNVVFPDVAMPHVMLDWQGEQQVVYSTVEQEVNGEIIQRQDIHGLELVKAGELSPEEFEKVVYDLVNFISYVGDPVKTQREKMGTAVILFLLILLVFAYLLKREYWKDIK